jgi:dihydroflavonol-4-reductase
LILGNVPGIPRLGFGMVDVRDVATAHIKAFESEKSNGQRYLLIGKSLWMEDLAKILAAEFKPLGYKVKTGTVGKFLINVVSIFDKKARSIKQVVGKETKFDNTKSVKELGIEYRDVSKCLVEMAYSMIEQGSIPDKRKKADDKKDKKAGKP